MLKRKLEDRLQEVDNLKTELTTLKTKITKLDHWRKLRARLRAQWVLSFLAVVQCQFAQMASLPKWPLCLPGVPALPYQ